jgi:hypothetical protein
MIDIFRYALVNNIPLRGCITSGCGAVSKSKRLLGPIANEGSKFYEIADWIGIVASYHTKMVLDNKVTLNPHPEIFEPFVKFKVPITKKIKKSSCWKEVIKMEDHWVLKWPIQQGFERKDLQKLVYVLPSNKKTLFGNIISNSKIEKTLQVGVDNTNTSVSRRWKNTRKFYQDIIHIAA